EGDRRACVWSSVTGRAGGEERDGAVLSRSVAEHVERGLPGATGHRWWWDVLRARAMAIDAPAHGQRLDLDDARHARDVAVALHAIDPSRDVDGVIEVREVREVVDAPPVDRLAREVAPANDLEHRGVTPDLRVTAHAQLGRRDTRCR